MRLLVSRLWGPTLHRLFARPAFLPHGVGQILAVEAPPEHPSALHLKACIRIEFVRELRELTLSRSWQLFGTGKVIFPGLQQLFLAHFGRILGRRMFCIEN